MHVKNRNVSFAVKKKPLFSFYSVSQDLKDLLVSLWFKYRHNGISLLHWISKSQIQIRYFWRKNAFFRLVIPYMEMCLIMLPERGDIKQPGSIIHHSLEINGWTVSALSNSLLKINPQLSIFYCSLCKMFYLVQSTAYRAEMDIGLSQLVKIENKVNVIFINCWLQYLQLCEEMLTFKTMYCPYLSIYCLENKWCCICALVRVFLSKGGKKIFSLRSKMIKAKISV